jgi:hypothetical protein
MRSGSIPFQFDISGVLRKARRIASKRVAGVTLSLPFVSVSVNPKDRERQIAREIVIRLKDRRVLSAWECCDDCIERALKSLEEIRAFLVEKEVELSDSHDGPLFLLIEMMAAGIRQFLTFEQRRSVAEGQKVHPQARQRLEESKQTYFDALEMLRGHLSRCLGQIAVLAKMDMPANGVIEGYQGNWALEAYKPESIEDKSDA